MKTCFRKTPNKLPFPADESGIMLNFVFAKRPVICATMQIMKQRDWHQIGSQSLDFMRVLIVYAHRALSC